MHTNPVYLIDIPRRLRASWVWSSQKTPAPHMQPTQILFHLPILLGHYVRCNGVIMLPGVFSTSCHILLPSTILRCAYMGVHACIMQTIKCTCNEVARCKANRLCLLYNIRMVCLSLFFHHYHAACVKLDIHLEQGCSFLTYHCIIK